MTQFNVTYDVVTYESAAHGDASESGFLAQGVSLREAVQLLRDDAGRYGDMTAIETDCSPWSAAHPPRWVTAYYGPHPYSGESGTISLHIPNSVTGASAARIARLLGSYGETRKAAA